MGQQKSIPDIRDMLQKAIDHLMVDHGCSYREAQQWLYQEARAKKAGLDEVAVAVLVGKTVHYGYDVPV